MITCAACWNVNSGDESYCVQCGERLPAYVGASEATLPVRDRGELTSRAAWGTARLNREAMIFLELPEASQPIPVTLKHETVIGRCDQNNPHAADIDLGPYQGFANGVSRKHAIIRVANGTVKVCDLGSANGTFLNGQGLIPDEYRVLRNGDELVLGRLRMLVYFAE